MSIDPYAAFVGFYNDWSHNVEGDIDFYSRLAETSGGPVVELGAGTGRISIPIAKRGIAVTGVDLSKAMLEEGRRRADEAGVADRLTFVETDMRDFVAADPVPLVIIPFRSFLHLASTDDQIECLRSVHASLLPGGRLALNFFVPDPAYIVAQEGKENFLDSFTDERGLRCEMYSIPRYTVATQRLRMSAVCRAYDGDSLVEETTSDLDLRMIYRYEFEHLLARTGFEVEALYGWFDERGFTEESREMVWVAKKR